MEKNMMERGKMENKVASILKTVGKVFAVIGIISALFIGGTLSGSGFDGGIAFGTFVFILLSSGFSTLCIYAFGEVIDLLQSIKNDTYFLEKSSKQISPPQSADESSRRERLDESIPKL
jgi:hypothetical protein